MGDKCRNIIKYVLNAFAILALVILFVWAWSDINAESTVDPDIPKQKRFDVIEKDIYIDGVLYNNWELKYPIYASGGKSYVPIDDDCCIIKELLENQDNDFQKETGVCGYHFEVDGNPIDLDDYVLMDNGKSYCAVRSLMKIGVLDASFKQTGFYISTDKNIKAEEYSESNPNEDYIKGRVAYILSQNPKLSEATAYHLEYLFRHAAACTTMAEPDLLLVMARLESNFNADIGTRVVGLMQVMLKYAQRKGYTYKDLCDPHINLHYGAGYISDRLEYFGGDEIKALSAYNLGLIPVILTDTYSTAYAQRVLSARQKMYTWLEKNNYSTDQFVERIELN